MTKPNINAIMMMTRIPIPITLTLTRTITTITTITTTRIIMKNTNNYTYQIVEMLQAKLVLTGGVRTQVSPKSTVRHSPPRILPPAAAATPADRQRLHRRTPTRHIHSPRAHPPPASPRAYARAHRTPRTRAHTPEAALTRAPSRLKTRDAERVGRGARPVRSEPAWRRRGQADLELMQFGTLKMLMAQQLQSQADMQVVDWDVVRPSERERGREREREREREGGSGLGRRSSE